MAEIIPAIIPKSFKDLEEKVNTLSGLSSFIHLDVTDGKFGGELSWPFQGDNGEFKKILNQDIGLPHWEEFDYEVHLMTKNPLSYAKDWIDAGVSRIIFHVEALNYEDDIQFLDQLKTEGLVQIGITINADTPEEDIVPYFGVVDFFQVMTIPNVGLQGASFDTRGIDKLRWIKKNYKEMIVSVDGGMRPETAEIALDAGADRIICGSYIVKSDNPRIAMEEMKSLI